MSWRDYLPPFLRRAGLPTPGDASGSQYASVIAPRFAMPPRWANNLLEAYDSFPWLRAVVHRIMSSVASTEWCVYQMPKPGSMTNAQRLVRRAMRRSDAESRRLVKAAIGAGDLVEIEDHPLAQMIERGNESMPGGRILALCQAHLDLVGDGFALIESNAMGGPTELWNIPPTWVARIPLLASQREDDRKFWIRYPGGSGLAGMAGIGGRELKLPPEQVLWFKDVRPADPYGRGMSMAHALADELDADEQASHFMRDLFFNNARPDYIMSIPGLQSDELLKLRESWAAKYKGKPGREAIMNRELKIAELGSTPQELQFVELRRFERDQIVQVFGIPPEIFGIIESSNRATIEAADYLYSRLVVAPRLELLRESMSHKLLPLYKGEAIYLDFESPVAEDREYRKEIMTAAPWAFTRDEWREEGDFPELETDAGDVFLVPINLTETPADAVPGGDVDEAPGETGPDDGEEGDGDQAAAARRVRRKRRRKVGRPDKNVLAAEVDPEDLLDASSGIIYATVEDFGDTMVQNLGLSIDFNMNDPRVVNYLGQVARARIRGANATTQTAIRDAISEGLADGDSIPELATRVESIFDQAEGWRSVLIARTETVAAANFGTQASLQQAGIEEKEWLAVRDDRTRDSHAALDGQIVAIGADFTSPDSGATGPYPGELSGGAAENANCRCSILPVLTEGESIRDARSTSIAPEESKRVALWKASDTRRMGYEKKFGRALKAAFRKQRERVLAKLRGSD